MLMTYLVLLIKSRHYHFIIKRIE